MTQITIPSEPISVNYAVTSSSVGPFVVPFSFMRQKDVIAIVTDALMVETAYEVVTDFFFSTLLVPPGQEGNGFTGGEITLNLPIGADLNSSIRIFRSTVIDRTSNYPNTGPFSMPLLNDEQNNHIAIMQELAANQSGGFTPAGNLQGVTDLGNITNNALILHDDPQTQALTISQTLNPAVIDTTGAGINFTGATVEYHFNTFVRAVGGFRAQSNGSFSAWNSLGTDKIEMRHDDTWGILETVFGTPLLLRSFVGGVYFPEIAAAGASTAAFGQLWVNSVSNPNELMFTDESGNDINLVTEMWDNATRQVLSNSGGIAVRNRLMIGDDDNGFGSGDGHLYIASAANATVDFPNMGQFWARSSSPVRPTFTNEDGDDQLLDPSISEIISVVASRVGILTDKGKTVAFTGGTAAQVMTIPAEGSVPHQIGTYLSWDNNGSVSFDIAITTDTLVFAQDQTTGTRTLGPGGIAVALKIAAGVWKIDGAQMT